MFPCSQTSPSSASSSFFIFLPTVISFLRPCYLSGGCIIAYYQRFTLTFCAFLMTSFGPKIKKSTVLLSHCLLPAETPNGGQTVQTVQGIQSQIANERLKCTSLTFDRQTDHLFMYISYIYIYICIYIATPTALILCSVKKQIFGAFLLFYFLLANPTQIAHFDDGTFLFFVPCTFDRYSCQIKWGK